MLEQFFAFFGEFANWFFIAIALSTSSIIIALLYASKYIVIYFQDYNSDRIKTINFAITNYSPANSSNKTTRLGKQFLELLGPKLQNGIFPNYTIQLLQRRFPIEQPIWKHLVNQAPETYQQLLRGLNIDILLWVKPDPNFKRVKLFAFAKKEKSETVEPYDFGPSTLEPLPIADLKNYQHAISLFALAQAPVPPVHNRKKFATYAVKVEDLSRYLDRTMDSSEKNMPASFRFTLLNLQAWAWFISGTALADTARLSRSIRSFQQLLENWPANLLTFEKKQVLVNLAMAKLNYAKRMSVAESFEQVLDTVTLAQKTFSRFQYPYFWAKMQEIRAHTEIELTRRQADDTRLESVLHTFRTILRVWSAPGYERRYAETQKHIADILLQLGQSHSGTERLEQSIFAYRKVLKIWETHRPSPYVYIQTHSHFASALLELANRTHNITYLADAIDILKIVLQALDLRLIKGSTYAECLHLLGCAYLQYARSACPAPNSAYKAENPKNTSQEYFKRSLKVWRKDNQKKPHISLIKTLEYLGDALCDFDNTEALVHTSHVHIDKNMKNNKQALECYQQTIEAWDKLQTLPKTHALNSDLSIRLQHKLANVLRVIGELEKNESFLTKACTLYQSILKTWDEYNTTHHRIILEQCHIHHALAYTLIARSKLQRDDGHDQITLAIDHYRHALRLIRREDMPYIWADINDHLGDALRLSGAIGGGTPELECAVKTFYKSYDFWTEKNLTEKKMCVLLKIGYVLADIGRRQNNHTCYSQAYDAFSESYDGLIAIGRYAQAETIHKQIIQLETILSYKTKPESHIVYHPGVANSSL
ncbi:MAG: hypothetical protein AAF228_04440 [Pseudomonadota bacterium]